MPFIGCTSPLQHQIDCRRGRSCKSFIGSIKVLSYPETCQILDTKQDYNRQGRSIRQVSLSNTDLDSSDFHSLDHATCQSVSRHWSIYWQRAGPHQCSCDAVERRSRSSLRQCLQHRSLEGGRRLSKSNAHEQHCLPIYYSATHCLKEPITAHNHHVQRRMTWRFVARGRNTYCHRSITKGRVCQTPIPQLATRYSGTRQATSSRNQIRMYISTKYLKHSTLFATESSRSSSSYVWWDPLSMTDIDNLVHHAMKYRASLTEKLASLEGKEQYKKQLLEFLPIVPTGISSCWTIRVLGLQKS